MKIEIPNFKRSKKIIIPSLIIGVGIILIAFLLLTKVNEIQKLRKSVKSLKKEKEELRNKFLMLSSFNLEEIKKNSALAELAVPSEISVPYILQAFRDSVQEADFLVKDFKFTPGEMSKDKSKKSLDELPLTANLVGPIENLGNLLVELETTFPLFEVTSLEFSSGYGTEKASLNIKLLTYYSPPLVDIKMGDIEMQQLVLNDQEDKLLKELNNYSRPTLKGIESRSLERKGDNPFAF